MSKQPAPPGYITWSNPREFALASAEVGHALAELEPVLRAAGSDLYLNVGPGNASVGDGYSRRDYEYFRPDEATPRNAKDSIRACQAVYRDVGLVRNVIDLMSDFAVQGIEISHRNESTERFYREWWRRVGGPERSERFLNLLYRTSNVVVRRQTAKLSPAEVDRLRRAVAEAEVTVLPPPKLGFHELPWRYSFINPLQVDLVQENLVTFLGPDYFVFTVKVPEELVRLIRNPQGEGEKEFVRKLPAALKDQILRQKYLTLDRSKISVWYYKRDDWCPWALPMLHSILPNLTMLKKIELADMSALDGIISSIRVWKLGSLEHKIMPSPTMLRRLAQILANKGAGGVMDLVWGPDLELKETSTDGHRFLGDNKYKATLAAIYAGLGIPPTLTGSEASFGFTNNYISLKTLTERLEYGRSIVKAFWEEEIRLVQQAMGFRYPATIGFDKLLTDEAQEKQLLINLADRDLISTETLQEVFGLTPEIEKLRIRREFKRRAGEKLPPKASPFHNPQQYEALEKQFALTGMYAPSEFGVELLPKKAGEQAPEERRSELKPDVPKGQPGQGRPLLSNDKEKRKQKVVKPRTTAEFLEKLARVEAAQQEVAHVLTGAFLKAFSKKNLREFTDEEAADFERFKWAVLCALPLEHAVGRATVIAACSRPVAVPPEADALFKAVVQRYVAHTGRVPTLEIQRRFQAHVTAVLADATDPAANPAPPLPRTGPEPAGDAGLVP